MSLRTQILFALIVAFCFGVFTESCVPNTTTSLDHISQRQKGYILGASEKALCDYSLTEGWYSLGNNVLARSPEPCGTTYNWYSTDELPEDENEERELTACRASLEEQCAANKTIWAKKCYGTYLFYLVDLDSCPDAYCLQPQNNGTNTGTTTSPVPDISGYNVSITTDVNNVERLLLFYCDFNPANGTDYFYQVTWNSTTHIIGSDLLYRSQPTQFTSIVHFRNATMLTETYLRDRGVDILGLTIVCSVSASFARISEQSSLQLSMPFFIGIEVVNRSVTVENQEEVTVFLRLTVPFACPTNSTCFLDVDMSVPTTGDANCQLSNLVKKTTISDTNQCGVRFFNADKDSLKPLMLQARLGDLAYATEQQFTVILTTQRTFPSHPLFANYTLDPVSVTVKTNHSRLSGNLCYSHNDPHMRTFDRYYYDNQNRGRFLLYRNTDAQIHQQVQIQTKSCFSEQIFCNCGVAVNAGRDVFVISICETRSFDVQFPLCEDGILSRSVKKLSSTEFVVYLPTGTEVHIFLDTYYLLLNVNIRPSLADWLKTEGLCGLFDGDANDDLKKRNGSSAPNIPLSWRVQPEEDLFSNQSYAHLQPWNSSEVLCQCDAKGGNKSEILATCTTENVKKCPDSAETPAFQSRCQVITREKRSIDDDVVDHGVDFHVSSRTAFVVNDRRRRQLDEAKLHNVELVRRSVYDDITGRADCLKAFNTSTFRMCSNLPTISFDSIVNDCTLDAIATNTLNWAQQHLEQVKSICLKEIKANKPLEVNGTEGVTVYIEGVAYRNVYENNLIVPVPTEFTSEYLEEVEAVTCTNECNRQGTCTDGVCVCNNGFIGQDCSVDGSQPPEMLGIPDDGLCDLQQRECKRTSVFCLNMAETAELACRMTLVKITDSSIYDVSDAIITPGELETFMEVSCSLPEKRRKREETFDAVLATGYKIAITNDGKIYSEADTFLIFNSICVSCTRSENEVSCAPMPGYCVNGGQCYTYGDRIGCHLCTGDTNSTVTWSNADCETPDGSEGFPLWAYIVIPILGILALVGIILAVVFCFNKYYRTGEVDYSGECNSSPQTTSNQQTSDI